MTKASFVNKDIFGPSRLYVFHQAQECLVFLLYYINENVTHLATELENSKGQAPPSTVGPQPSFKRPATLLQETFPQDIVCNTDLPREHVRNTSNY